MTQPLVLRLEHCADIALAGGKAVGLARLFANGFHVPPGICVTTAAYDGGLRATGLEPHGAWQSAIRATGGERERILADYRAAILGEPVPDQLFELLRTALADLHQPAEQRWAVRSSATNEDAGARSFAGLYRTELGVALEAVPQSILSCWASLWEKRFLEYHLRGDEIRMPLMAVVIQPVVAARAAGVAYSIHPVTGRSNHVVVNAVPGLAAALVEGTVVPDQYVVRCDGDSDRVSILHRTIAKKDRVIRLGGAGVRQESLAQEAGNRSSITDDDLVALARLAKLAERKLQHPVDLEWAIDDRDIWLLQARAVTVVPHSAALTNDDCEWSRTNFKETMPELPSPLGLSFLEKVMESFILEPYRKLGCKIPPGVSSARIVRGRPYINVTLMHSLVVQLGGDPSILAEQMGGQPLADPPSVERLDVWTLLRAGLSLMWHIGQTRRRAPGWFAAMQQMAVDHGQAHVKDLSFDDVKARLADISQQLDLHELTFGIAGGVTQCLQVLGFLLPRWLGDGWRGLLNGALQGQAQAISALQIIRLAELVEGARSEPRAYEALLAESWEPAAFRERLQGTDFLKRFDRYLDDYGHRGIGESDIMSPRFADQPELILDTLRVQLRMPTSQSPAQIVARQDAMRAEAVREIRRRFGWRLHRWAIFSWWHRRLCRYFALREANRHHLMYYARAGRNLLLRAGSLLTERGVIDEAHDIFFIRLDEQEELLNDSRRDWRSIVRARKDERARNAAVSVSDTIRAGDAGTGSVTDPSMDDGVLRGLPISAGTASGPVRLVRTMADWSRVTAGDILVAPVIDPGMAPLFGVAEGLIAEMGGTLSHGAIIAREYGLPTIANVPHATSLLKDGQQVELRADQGAVRVLGSEPDAAIDRHP